MYREMRRKDKKLSEEDTLQVLKTAPYGMLSTVGEDNIPYGVPINFVYKDDKVFFHSGVAGHKLDNIKMNDNVSFCVVTDVETLPAEFNTKFKSVIIFGTAEEVQEEKKVEVFKLFLEKFSPDFMESGVEYIHKASKGARIFQINIEHMTAKGKI
ncbi:pyridoxamine 5'-phosphate oxidase family protein [Aminipila butyrica]|uniref:Pyridoxamine 5'-phosphate oxidase family protein n=1 Tax=Aminipila butyrica TaxID=433296 RepID=A0A858BV26_9FIRM|nr:pyridoxamine 5'-phosphate oxidase family protein [Aminipila butyrica]QIB69242.1 pyridoxamine 5'-phosphate oxidase family protein [Aminipila butyrica]